ncbi:MAG: hypothetical protein L3J50_00235 [Emcibacter sp.]|nr:hypothetical protein [Emcibacter sp.]
MRLASLIVIFTAILSPFFITPTFALITTGKGDIPGDKSEKPQSPPTVSAFEGSMTLDHMGVIIKRLDDKAKQTRKGFWEFKIIGIPVVIVTDEKNDRMRILVGIKKVANMGKEELMRLSQANFDSALDARYAIAKGVLWAAYIHPLRALHDKQFISAIGQTVNIVKEYGKSYSSGALFYGGGDSEQILKEQLIQQLQKKGLEI